MQFPSILASSGPVVPNFGRSSSCVVNNGTFCWGWFSRHWTSSFLPRLIQHIELTTMAVGAGFIIALLLALIAYWVGWLTTPITFVSSLLYAIPSLAAFEILVPITGINNFTVEIALVSYTLLVLFTNILAGLSEVPSEISEAAIGQGLTTRQVLIRIELPLALPFIFAGLRVATVMIISLTTVAAYIVPEGLGVLIFNALHSGDFNTSFIAAGVLTSALALVADGFLVVIQKLLTPWSSTRRSI